MENKKFTKKEALKEISDILIELDMQEVKDNAIKKEIEEQNKINAELSEKALSKAEKIINEFGSEAIYHNYSMVATDLSKYFKKKIRLNKNGMIVEFIVDDKILIQLPHNLFKTTLVGARYNVIRNLLAAFIFKKEHASKIEKWSYVNEKEESKTVSEQTTYNQTLNSLFKFSDFDNLIVNIKLKPLVETLSSYNPETMLLNSKIKVTFTASIKDENIIYAYRKSDKDQKIGKIYLESHLDLFTTLFGENPAVVTNYVAIEITNLDNGLFGIENKLFRVENNKELVMYISNEADLEYILEVIKFNKRFEGIEHIDLKNPETKYSYHTEMLSKIKNKK